jgi:hypothetical protein
VLVSSSANADPPAEARSFPCKRSSRFYCSASRVRSAKRNPSLLPAHGVQFGHTVDVSRWGGCLSWGQSGRSEYVDQIPGATERMPRWFHTRFVAVGCRSVLVRVGCRFCRTLPGPAEGIALFSLFSMGREQTLDQHIIGECEHLIPHWNRSNRTGWPGRQAY